MAGYEWSILLTGGILFLLLAEYEKDRDNAIKWYLFSFLLWIGTIWQWGVDQQGTDSFAMIWLFTVPWTYCIINILIEGVMGLDHDPRSRKR